MVKHKFATGIDEHTQNAMKDNMSGRVYQTDFNEVVSAFAMQHTRVFLSAITLATAVSCSNMSARPFLLYDA